MARKEKYSKPLRVVYLLGAGATQADVSLKDETIHILMRDVKEGIEKKINKKTNSELLEIKNELTKEETDVEHLITLYESTGITKHDIIAKKLKQLFIDEIKEKVKKLGVGYIPKLLSALIDMHEIASLKETLSGIITTNYEDFLEKAMQDVKGGIDYSIKIHNRHSCLIFQISSTPLLKLHGSFNWKNEFPIALVDEHEIACPEDVLWIPPGVEKKREKYPFNILWGRAREILDCDILRIMK